MVRAARPRLNLGPPGSSPAGFQKGLIILKFREPERDIPIVGETDVLVCGGGPAGVAAALAAARAGARTQLLEGHGCLGGIWTAGAMSFLLDAANKPGLMRELLDELTRREACGPRTWGGYICDPEALKLLLEELCQRAGVHVRLATRVVAAARGADKRLALAVTESKSGREAWAAKVFIDATGDGDLAARAGCNFDFGDPATGRTQPMSLIALLSGIRPDELPLFLHEQSRNPAWRDDSRRLLEALKSVGVEPSYGAPILLPVYDCLYALMANHQYGVSALDAGQIGAATMQARAELHRIVAALRSLGGPWRGLRLVATAEQIGVREGRRVHGRYALTVNDLAAGARFDDAVCRVTFGVDVHAPDPSQSKSFDNRGLKARPYDVPLRALIARDVDGLLLAGRCISGDFVAHSSYRVTGNSVAMGEAAGLAAALSVADGCLPHELPWARIAPALAQAQAASPALETSGGK